MEAAIRAIQSSLEKIHSDVSAIQSDMAGMKSDMAGMKSDMAGMKSDMAGMKSDIAGVKSDLAHTRLQVDGIRAEMATKAELKALEDRMAWRSDRLASQYETCRRESVIFSDSFREQREKLDDHERRILGLESRSGRKSQD